MDSQPQSEIELSTVKSRPIIFNAFSVLRILDGRKTQTRRPMKPQPPDWIKLFGYSAMTPRDGLHISGRGIHPEYGSADAHFRIPFGKKGDRLWVKETWQVNIDGYWYQEIPKDYVWDQSKAHFYYKANLNGPAAGGWRSPIFMPRWASRITLEIESIRVERLQNISDDDALAEGAYFQSRRGAPHDQYRQLWNEINEKKPEFQWDKNPWVWVINFRRLSDESK